jgi:hypothetical protein
MTNQRFATASAVLGMMVLYPLVTKADDGSERVTTRPLPGPGRPVVARTDAEGAIHLLYASEDGSKYAKSAGGVTFGPAIAVVGEGSRQSGLEYSAWDMAVGKGGRVHVAMGTNAWKLKLPQEEWGFFYASLDPGSAVFPSRSLRAIMPAFPGVLVSAGRNDSPLPSSRAK